MYQQFVPQILEQISPFGGTFLRFGTVGARVDTTVIYISTYF